MDMRKLRLNWTRVRSFPVKPIEAFHSLLRKSFLHGLYPKEPGGTLKWLSKSERDALKDLTSDEVSKQRIPWL